MMVLMSSCVHPRPSPFLRAIALAALAGLAANGVRADDAALTFFESRVRPALVEHCVACHGPEKQKGGLRLDHGSFLAQGGDNGPAVAPGDPGASRLLDAVGYANVELQMPPSGRLPEAVVADLHMWIVGGAVWPVEPIPGAAPVEAFDLAARRAAHWAWQPLQTPSLPAVDMTWPRNGMDTFVLAKLTEAGLAPAPPATPSTLLRRVTFDLTGLPPSAADAQAFAQDTQPGAYERAVDRLLASVHFGEHWARKWLDLTRYAESYGFEQDFGIPEAWRYRDYVIRALNADLPYDQFVREHIAGDLLESPRRDPATGSNESILATGWWRMYQSQHAPVDVRLDHAERIDNQIDVFSKTFLGMTVSCARCHDHKFDAISTADYYGLAGIFRSARQDYVELDPGSQIAAAAQQTKSIHARGVALLRAQHPAPPPASAEVPMASGDVFEDFEDGYAGWFPAGVAFGEGPTGAPDWMPHKGAGLALPPGVAHSGRHGAALRGTLRSPSFRLSTDRILLRASGSQSTIRLVIEGYMLRDIVPLLFESTWLDVNHGPEFRWLEMAGLKKYEGCQAYLELSDPGEGYLGVDRVAFSNGPPPEVAIDTVPAFDTAALTPLALEMENTLRALPAPARAFALAEGNGVDEPVFVRGNPKNHGPVVPRRFLEAIAGTDQAPVGAGSGRLALAGQVLDPANPLTARVFVNRVWHHLFGRGIVPTVDNFGAMGQPPSHPELLDYLATRFRTEGWSIKRLIRELVTSETYRMSSIAQDPRAEEIDPTNSLLHRMPLRRLPAEPVRDALLAVAGTLDANWGGPSVQAYISPFMGGQRRPETSGPMDGARRRAIYLEVRRNFLPTFLQVFDFPTPDTTRGARNVSNVPAQSLVLMNDPFVAEQAQAWGARACASEAASPEQRIESLYWEAFARPPQPQEIATALAFLREQTAHYAGPAPESLRDPRAWADLCHALFTLKEFIFIG